MPSKLIDYEIDILTEKEESEKKQIEFKDKTETSSRNRLSRLSTLACVCAPRGFTVSKIWS